MLQPRSNTLTHVIQSIGIVLTVSGSVSAALVYLTWGQAQREGDMSKATAILAERTTRNEKDIEDLHRLTTEELRRITDAVSALRTDVIRNEPRRR